MSRPLTGTPSQHTTAHRTGACYPRTGPRKLTAIDPFGDTSKQTLTLTEAGRAALIERLRAPADTDVTDPYRRGMFVVARATSGAERAWLKEQLT